MTRKRWHWGPRWWLALVISWDLWRTANHQPYLSYEEGQVTKSKETGYYKNPRLSKTLQRWASNGLGWEGVVGAGRTLVSWFFNFSELSPLKQVLSEEHPDHPQPVSGSQASMPSLCSGHTTAINRPLLGIPGLAPQQGLLPALHPSAVQIFPSC